MVRHGVARAHARRHACTHAHAHARRTHAGTLARIPKWAQPQSKARASSQGQVSTLARMHARMHARTHASPSGPNHSQKPVHARTQARTRWHARLHTSPRGPRAESATVARTHARMHGAPSHARLHASPRGPSHSQKPMPRRRAKSKVCSTRRFLSEDSLWPAKVAPSWTGRPTSSSFADLQNNTVRSCMFCTCARQRCANTALPRRRASLKRRSSWTTQGTWCCAERAAISRADSSLQCHEG